MDIWKDGSMAGRKARWQAFWAMEDLPRPLWFIPTTPALLLASILIPMKKPVTRLFLDMEYQYRQEMRMNRITEFLRRWFWKDDFVPHLQAQQGVVVFASPFKVEVEFPNDQMPWVRKEFIQEGEPAEKVYDLPVPDVYDSHLGETIRFSQYFQEQSRGKYPIAITDVQGPMDTAYLVWDSCDFMVAMYEHPKEVHHIMRLVTDLQIKYVREMRRLIREFVPVHFPPAYLPDGMGLALSEDCLAVLSPALYEEFSLPYVNELSEEFGGVLIHSCGNISHQLGVLAKVKNLRGLNFSVTETPFETVWSRFGGRVPLICHVSPENVIVSFKNQLQGVEYVLQRRDTNRGLCFMTGPMGNIHKQSAPPKFDVREFFGFGKGMRELFEKYPAVSR